MGREPASGFWSGRGGPLSGFVNWGLVGLAAVVVGWLSLSGVLALSPI